MAGVCAGSLSTVSSALNSLGAVALKDFLPAKIRDGMSTYKQVDVK